jgi:bacillolysin
MTTFTRLFLSSAMLFASVAHGQYCMLPGRTPYINIQPGITNFKLNTINRTSLPVESMSTVVVVTNDTTTLLRGHTYTVYITHTRDSINFPAVRNNIRVWIDYNNNHSFEDAGELVVTADHQTYGLFTATFTVPTTAPIGIVRLRATAKMSDEGGHILPSSCDSPSVDPLGYHGEMEDYTLKIQAPTAIEEVNEHANNVVLYPNPFTSHVTVAFDEIKNDAISVDLFDITGKQVGNLLHNQLQSALTYTFDLDKYASSPGIYFIRISSVNGTETMKVVKTN